MGYKKNNFELNCELEQLRADNAKLSALLDYVAVMVDVDIPDDMETPIEMGENYVKE